MTRQRFILTALAAALVATVALLPSARAGGCRRGGFVVQSSYCASACYAPCYSTPYCPPAVVVEDCCPPIQATVITQEVLAPAYVFQVLNAFSAPGPAGTMPYQAPAGGYAPAASYQQQASYQAPPQPPPQAQQGVVRLDPAQLAELARLIRSEPSEPPTLEADDGPPPIGDTQPISAERLPAVPPPSGESEVLHYFGTNCASCHQQGQGPKGGVILFDVGGYFRPSRTNGQPLPLVDIVRAVHPTTGSMPKGRQKMPAELYAKIPQHWYGGQAYNR